MQFKNKKVEKLKMEIRSFEKPEMAHSRTFLCCFSETHFHCSGHHIAKH